MDSLSAQHHPEVFPEARRPERLGPPAQPDAEQQAAAQELVQGPRKGVYGPFRALLQRPPLLRAVASVGESLRFHGTLEPALREFTICVVAAAQGNSFEWDMHAPLAQSAGVPARALACLLSRQALPDELAPPLVLAHTAVHELLATHRLAESTFAACLAQWGEAGLVELIALAGYFAMIDWLMNVARTPGKS